MKKIVFGALLAVLSIPAVACGGADPAAMPEPLPPAASAVLHPDLMAGGDDFSCGKCIGPSPDQDCLCDMTEKRCICN